MQQPHVRIFVAHLSQFAKGGGAGLNPMSLYWLNKGYEKSAPF
jgi:hypothetical protein